MVKYAPNSHAPLRVFIGTSAGGEDAEACAIIETSLRRHASIQVEVEWLRLSRDLISSCAGWRTERWSTPWTALRWAVPAICGWRGRAVYFDCPTLILGDVAELGGAATIPSGAFVLARCEGSSLLTGCLVFDCIEAKKHLPPLAKMKEDVGAHQEVGGLLDRRPVLVGALPGGWGRTDADFARKAPVGLEGSVHFISPHTQPHGPAADIRLAKTGRAHWFAGARLPHYCARLVAMWGEEALRAADEGYVVGRYVPDEPFGSYAIGGADRVDAGKRV